MTTWGSSVGRRRATGRGQLGAQDGKRRWDDGVVRTLHGAERDGEVGDSGVHGGQAGLSDKERGPEATTRDVRDGVGRGEEVERKSKMQAASIHGWCSMRTGPWTDVGSHPRHAI